ncbi:MAG TPA: hypothetical protein VGB25_00495 [Candidatus Binatia bacterium]
MDKIEPLKDHLALARIAPGDRVRLWGKTFNVFGKTTLGTGEPALVLQGEGEQFVLRASEYLAQTKGA